MWHVNNNNQSNPFFVVLLDRVKLCCKYLLFILNIHKAGCTEKIQTLFFSPLAGMRIREFRAADSWLYQSSADRRTEEIKG